LLAVQAFCQPQSFLTENYPDGIQASREWALTTKQEQIR